MNPTIETLLDRVQKPGRYAGGELNSVVKDRDAVRIRFAFCFPDLYEVGMSHLGMKILYGLFNSMEDVWCERVFAPDTDMEALMREEGVPLFGIESGDPVREFDFIGFTLQYEMSFTAVLNMLDLAGLPVRAEERGDTGPIVVAGGPCACNPEPLADFIDLFTLGEGEEVNAELLELYRSMQGPDFSKRAFLKAAARIEGVYVPSLYHVAYHDDGTVAAVTPAVSGAAGSARRVSSTVRSGKNRWIPSTVRAARSVNPRDMRNSPCPPCPRAITPGCPSSSPGFSPGRRRPIPIFPCLPCGWTGFQGISPLA